MAKIIGRRLLTPWAGEERACSQGNIRVEIDLVSA
jgi:hypothetical protein